MRTIRAQWSVAVICFVLGIMLSVQFQTTRYYQINMLPERVEDLTSQIKTVSKEKAALEQEVNSLTTQLTNSQNYNQAMADLQKELVNANLAVGYIPVQGPGVVISIDDNPKSLTPEDDPYFYIVHDVNLLILTNELKATGAEAISINNQRITAMSEIRCAGNLIIVNGIKIGPPYVINVIGNSDVLYGIMKSKNGHLESLNIRGFITAIDKSDNITIPALIRPQSFLRSIET